MNQLKLRRMIVAGVTVGAALSLSAIPATASAKTAKSPDPYLAFDTQMKFSASAAGGGSTFAGPLENAAQAYYQARNTNATLAGYQLVGSGAGETGVLNGTFNWGGTDVPMAQTDIAAREPSGDNYTLSQFEQVPIGLGGVAIAYNLPGTSSKEHLNLTAKIIAEIYLGKITKWNDPQIAALNTVKKNPTLSKSFKLPNHAIVPVCRADSSGTTYITSNFLGTAAASTWKTPPSKNSPIGAGCKVLGSGNPGVATDILGNKYSLGYVEYSYILLNPKLKAGYAAILNKTGKYVLPSPVTIAEDAAKHPDLSPASLADYSIVYQAGATSYPISGYTWAVVFQTQPNFDTGTLVVKYLDWLSHSEPAGSGLVAGQDVAAQQGYVPLPANIQALATATLLKVKGPSGQTLLVKSSN